MNAEGILVEKMQASKNYNIKFDEKINKDFKERLDKMAETYKNSKYYKKLVPANPYPIPIDRKINQSSWIVQFKAILMRAFRNEIRNPMDLKTRLVATIVNSAICIIVFEGVSIKFFDIDLKNF